MKNSKKINWELIFLIALILFGFFLRVYSLGQSPFWIDESASFLASKNILVHGIPILDSGMLYQRSYVFHYIGAGFLSISQNEFFARLPSVIFGLLTILLAYFIGKEYSKSGGILAALFMSVFYLEVFFSRQARFYQLFQLVFFLSLYLLYKSKNNNKYLYLALIAFFITLDTQIEGLILAPFFILHILIYSKRWNKLASIIPLIPLVYHFIPVLGLSTISNGADAINYASSYFGFARNMVYMLILFIPGVIWGFIKKKRLTLLIVLPAALTLIGIFTIETFALRYSYFFVFPLVLYSSLLLSFLYEKLGKILLIAIIAVLLFPSNLFFQNNFVNVILPQSNFYDYTAPTTNYKIIPLDLKESMRNNTLVSLYSADVEFYIKKPDYVIPFTMDGRGEDQISWNSSKGVVDRYSGAPILVGIPTRPYYVAADSFSISKLKPDQQDKFSNLVENCSVSYSAADLKVYYCN